MLSPELIQQMNQLSGLNKPAAPAANAGASRAAQIRQMAPAPAAPSSSAERVGSAAGPVGAAIGRTIDNPHGIVDAAKAGFEQGKAGVDEILHPKGTTLAEGIAQGAEGALKVGSGIASMAFSPLAPAFKPSGEAIQKIPEAVSDIPGVSKAAAGLPDLPYQRLSENAANLSNVTGGIAGAEGVAAVPGKVKAVAGDIKANMGAKAAPEAAAAPKEAEATPVKSQNPAHAAIENEVRNTAAKYPSVGKVLNHAEVKKGTDPVSVLSSYASGKALPTLYKGKLQVDNATAFIKKQIGSLSQIRDRLVEGGKAVKTPDELKSLASAKIQDQSWSQAKKTAMTKDVNALIEDLKESYPKGIPNTEMNRLKTEHAEESTSYNSKSKFSLDAHSIVAQVAKEQVELAGGAAPIEELNKLISSHYSAMDVLNAMRGKTPHGGALSRAFNNVLGEVGGFAGGTVLGHPFLGAMAGRAGAEAVTEIVNNHFISNPLKRAIVNSMEDAAPDVILKAKEHLNPSPQTSATETIPGTSLPNESTPTEPVKPTPAPKTKAKVTSPKPAEPTPAPQVKAPKPKAPKTPKPSSDTPLNDRASAAPSAEAFANKIRTGDTFDNVTVQQEPWYAADSDAYFVHVQNNATRKSKTINLTDFYNEARPATPPSKQSTLDFIKENIGDQRGYVRLPRFSKDAPKDTHTRLISKRELDYLNSRGFLPANKEGMVNLVNPNQKVRGVAANKKYRVYFAPEVADLFDSTSDIQSAVKGPIHKDYILAVKPEEPDRGHAGKWQDDDKN